jgi:predicted RNase H-like nuclease (RuvC/YqgF family)
MYGTGEDVTSGSECPDQLLGEFFRAIGGLHSRPAKKLFRWARQQKAEEDREEALKQEQHKQQVQEQIQQKREECAKIHRPLVEQAQRVIALQQRVRQLKQRLANPFGTSPPVQVSNEAAARRFK